MVGSVIEMCIATAMGLHLAAALPRLAYPSYLMSPLKYREQITAEQITVVDAHVAVPTGPRHRGRRGRAAPPRRPHSPLATPPTRKEA